MILDLLFAIFTQFLPFFPLAIGISTSYTLLRATDLSLDGSFVLGAVVFARLISLGISPVVASIIALLGGAIVGSFVSFIQKGGRVDPLLAGVLVVFILTSLNLILLGKPNVSLLNAHTLFSSAFQKSLLSGWSLVFFVTFIITLFSFIMLHSRFGLLLRALGDNAQVMTRMGYPVEIIRTAGFSFTNLLASASGIITAQIYGYADIGMGLGVTLTGICTILIGQQFVKFFLSGAKQIQYRNATDFISCLCGVFLYFTAVNVLLRFDMNPVYLKMVLGLTLIVFLRSFSQKKTPSSIGATA